MKKPLYILLIVFLFLNNFAYVILFLQSRMEIKKEMFRRIAAGDYSGELICFTFNNDSEIKWKVIWKDDHEFEFNGTMYDIVKKDTKGDTIILYCINDEKESELIKSFLKENSKEKNKSVPPLTKISLQNIITQALVKNSFYPEVFEQPYGYSAQFLNNYKSITLELPSPPPKKV